MGFLTWIFTPKQVLEAKQKETERRATRDAEIEKLKKLETDKLAEVQRAASQGDPDATVRLKEYEKALDDQSIKMLRNAAKQKMG